MRGSILLMMTCLSHCVAGQKIFTADDLVAIVKRFHPTARAAQLDVKIAAAELRASRGAFDPVLTHDHSRKDFDGITYYDQQWSELKIPTWYGIDINTGRELVKGDRINPEETKGTINYIGVSVPLLQNMVIDKRRAAVQGAKLWKEQSEVVRSAVVNDLVAEALVAYWDWWEQHQHLQVVQASLRNAKARFNMVQTAYRLGDRPAIDTLEAATQVQVFEQQQTEAVLQLQKSSLQLSLYLWSDGAVAYELPLDALPGMPRKANLPGLDTLIARTGVHPLLREYEYKLRGLAIEKRLKFQLLLPEVTAKYNGIARDFSKTMNGALLRNNYRFGLALSVPLRLSEGRGNYQAVKLKAEQTRIAQAAKEISIRNKVAQHYVEAQQTTIQYEQQQKLVLSYAALQKGEETRLANGESSLFLVNAREAKTIEGKQKEIALAAKVQQAFARLQWAAGLLGVM